MPKQISSAEQITSLETGFKPKFRYENPVLLTENFDGSLRLLHFYEIMDEQIKAAKDGSLEEKAFWWESYLTSGTASVTSATGDLKVVPGYVPLNLLVDVISVVQSGINLTDAEYDAIETPFSFIHQGLVDMGQIDQMKEGRVLQPSEAKQHPLRLALAGGDQDRLYQWVDAFVHIRGIIGKEAEGMAVHYREYHESNVILDPWVSNPVSAGSRASGIDSLANNYGMQQRYDRSIIIIGRTSKDRELEEVLTEINGNELRLVS